MISPPTSSATCLEGLPSLVVKLIAEALKEDEKDQSLSNLALTSKFVRAITAPVLWEVCEWNESFDWQTLFKNGSDVLQYIRVLEIITLKWNHSVDTDESSWRILSQCANLSFLSVQSGDPVLLPPTNIIFPNLVELELREYFYVQESDEALYQRCRWQGPTTTVEADPAVSFPKVESLFVEGGTAVVHAMCDQLKDRGDEEGEGIPSLAAARVEVDGATPHAFKNVRRLTFRITVENMWPVEEVSSQVFALPEETFQLFGPNAIKLDVEQDSVWDDELEDIHQGQKVTLMSCMPSLAGLAALEELRLSVDIVSHAEYDDNCEVRVQLREAIPPTKLGKPKQSRKVKIHGENVREALPRITKNLPALVKATLEWPLTFQDNPRAEKVDKVFSIVMKRGEGVDAELTWEETLELREDEPEVEEAPKGTRKDYPAFGIASFSGPTSMTEDGVIYEIGSIPQTPVFGISCFSGPTSMTEDGVMYEIGSAPRPPVFGIGHGPTPMIEDGIMYGTDSMASYQGTQETPAGPSTVAASAALPVPVKPIYVNLAPSLKGVNALLRGKGL